MTYMLSFYTVYVFTVYTSFKSSIVETIPLIKEIFIYKVHVNRDLENVYCLLSPLILNYS